MSQRTAFFASLPGKVWSHLNTEVRFTAFVGISMPSGAVGTKILELRLGKVTSRKAKGIVIFECIAKDGLTQLPEKFTSRWRAVRYLIESQGGIDLLIKERAEEASELFSKHGSWEVALKL